MRFTEQAWEAIAGIRAAIEAHPFLVGLRDGTLPREQFATYMAQDAHYLGAYSRVLALCAAQATDPDQVAFWARSADRAVMVELSLHAAHVTDLTSTEPSPTCTAYTCYLIALSTQGAYPVLAAGVLPCFWIYQDVGTRLQGRVGDPSEHPYGDWIGTYGDPAFTAATAQAKDLVDQLAAQSSPEVLQRMRAAFAAAARYEWMFWDAAWRLETWPLSAAANGSAITAATRNEVSDADNQG